ncbi:MAG: hypothetical protein AAGF20_00055 [Pseudomonadota bacterium]
MPPRKPQQPQTQQQGSANKAAESFSRLLKTYGPDAAVKALDELVRLGERAGMNTSGVQDEFSEVRNYGNVRLNPSDGNLHAFEEKYGYPPSVAANPAPEKTPFYEGERPMVPPSPYGPPANAFDAVKRR